ncbi:hypothetical protein AGOR_G00208250 [Albula goreensis]|uniref:Uncharacterized protein n=1 Tax=Albula goreensis TaxID=1534307 RepID=A0A8T3CLA3_9TELE|nr:hypothetical protein AGOR_G00208250 [Albula goreensis]
MNSASSDSSLCIGNESQIFCSSVISSNAKEKEQLNTSDEKAFFDLDRPCSEGSLGCQSSRDSAQTVLLDSLDSLPEVESLLKDAPLKSQHSLNVECNQTSSEVPTESPCDVTQSKGTSANLERLPVQAAQICYPTDKQNLSWPCSMGKNEDNALSQKLTLPSLAQCSLTSIPELLISEWKDLDEEPLEDFEKLEQLCCISGDEDTLGDIFLDNLELLESLKKTPEQRSRSLGETGVGKENSLTQERERRVDLKGQVEGIPESYLGGSNNMDQLLRSSLYKQPYSSQEMVLGPSSMVQSSEGDEKHRIEDSSVASPCHMSEKNKGQRSLSKMPTKNGLMMQVCEERLQYSLSENVKKNVLWGATVSDTAVIHPWGDPMTEGERQREKDSQGIDNKEKPQQAAQSVILDEPFVATAGSFSLTGQEPEITPPLVVSNQAMKAKLARLSLSLPPLALSLPLTPSPRVGFWEGGENRERGGRRRGASTSDPDEEEEEEQEEEGAGRVIVVTETDVDKRVGLRSLLKSPREPTEREKDRGRNVSFFDDVTVYLFDQETPTNELSTGSAPMGSAPTSPSPVQDDSRAAPSTEAFGASDTLESRESDDLSANPRLPGTNPVTSSRFTVSPAHDPHLV